MSKAHPSANAPVRENATEASAISITQPTPTRVPSIVCGLLNAASALACTHQSSSAGAPLLLDCGCTCERACCFFRPCFNRTRGCTFPPIIRSAPLCPLDRSHEVWDHHSFVLQILGISRRSRCHHQIPNNRGQHSPCHCTRRCHYHCAIHKHLRTKVGIYCPLK